MKLLEIWKRLGRQPLTTTKYQDARVFIDNKEYIITKIRYESGRLIGFEADVNEIRDMLYNKGTFRNR